MKMIKSSIIVLTTLLLFVSIMNVSVTALGNRVTFRPLEDWLLNNPPTFDWYSPDGDPYWAIIHVHESWDPFFALPEGVVGETQFDGYVTERVLNDGQAMITVYLHAQNAPLTIYSYWDIFDWVSSGFPPELPVPILGYDDDGSMEYSVWYTFILPAPGQEIPNFGALVDDLVAIRIEGRGYGTFTEYAANFGFTPGAEGTVHIRQIGLYAAGLKADFSGALADGWPVELIMILEGR